MSDIYLLGHKDWREWFYQGTGSGIEPFGVFAVTDTAIYNGINVLHGEEPAAESLAYCVNGPQRISTERPKGLYQSGIEILLKYEGEDPEIGDIYGPKAGQSEAVKGGTPGLWECLGVSRSDLKIMRARWLGAKGLTPAILYDDAAPNGTSIEAYTCNADGNANTTADRIQLDNTHPGNFRGYGSQHDGFDETTAAKVLYSTVNGKSMIVGGNGLAKTIIVANTGTGHTALTPSNASFMATFTRVCDDGQAPTADEIKIYNPGFTIDDNQDEILCTMDTGVPVADCIYRVVDADCPTTS